MNKKQPTQLRERTDYLRQKIDYLYEQVKYSGNFELKMKFIEFIDSSIQRVNLIEETKQYSSENVSRKYEQQFKAEQNRSQQKRIEKERQELQEKKRELNQRQQKMQLEGLKMELQSSRVAREKMARQASAKESELLQRIDELSTKVRAQERELERVGKLNSLQSKEIESLKEERNRAEKRELMWKEKYEGEFGDPEKFKKSKGKVIARNEQGLRILKTITNVTAQKKGNERYYFCELPVKFHVIKIVYGIKVGALKNGQQVEYFQQVSLYEKEEMEMFVEGGQLTLFYIKRKVKLNLKYRLQQNQIFIMLFGKGDSVAIDQVVQ